MRNEGCKEVYAAWKEQTSNEGCTNQCTKQVRMEEFAGHMDRLQRKILVDCYVVRVVI